MTRSCHGRGGARRSSGGAGSRIAGFTLVEVLVVMAVVAILATVAVPSYQDYVRRAHRADVQAALLDAAARQKQFVIDRRAYASTLAELGALVPERLAQRYEVTLEVPAGAIPPGFRVIASPIGAQAGDTCGTLSLDDGGARRPVGCW